MSAVRLDPSVRRSADGRVISGGFPPRVLRLSAAGATTLDEALAGRAPESEAGRMLIARLIGYGIAHPQPRPGAREALTIVIPARDEADAIAPLVERLVADGSVIVVDDGSVDETAARARAAGARVLRHERSRGPAAARNSGLAQARTELVAFVDADCLPAMGWATALAAYFDDPDLALVAPRVRGGPGRSAIARYERGCSPLDLGGAPCRVGPGRPVSYVPAAALVARARALRAVGGFDERLRAGEDVDLVWRLVRAGAAVRYEPAVVVEHRPRASLRGFARQRFDYGASAAALARRHGSAVAPLAVRPTSALLWLAATRGPLAATASSAVAIALAATDAVGGSRDMQVRRHALRLALAGQLAAGRHLARVLAREWLPVTLAVAAVARPARRVASLALAADAAIALRAVARDALPAGLGLRLLDNAAYAAGAWTGCVRERSVGALLPRRAGEIPAGIARDVQTTEPRL